jgi:hypothetical protein
MIKVKPTEMSAIIKISNVDSNREEVGQYMHVCNASVFGAVIVDVRLEVLR